MGERRAAAASGGIGPCGHHGMEKRGAATENAQAARMGQRALSRAGALQRPARRGGNSASMPVRRCGTRAFSILERQTPRAGP